VRNWSTTCDATKNIRSTASSNGFDGENLGFTAMPTDSIDDISWQWLAGGRVRT
jgi:hypothetical protein